MDRRRKYEGYPGDRAGRTTPSYRRANFGFKKMTEVDNLEEIASFITFGNSTPVAAKNLLRALARFEEVTGVTFHEEEAGEHVSHSYEYTANQNVHIFNGTYVAYCKLGSDREFKEFVLKTNRSEVYENEADFLESCGFKREARSSSLSGEYFTVKGVRDTLSALTNLNSRLEKANDSFEATSRMTRHEYDVYKGNVPNDITTVVLDTQQNPIYLTFEMVKMVRDGIDIKMTMSDEMGTEEGTNYMGGFHTNLPYAIVSELFEWMNVEELLSDYTDSEDCEKMAKDLQDKAGDDVDEYSGPMAHWEDDDFGSLAEDLIDDIFNSYHADLEDPQDDLNNLYKGARETNDASRFIKGVKELMDVVAKALSYYNILPATTASFKRGEMSSRRAKALKRSPNKRAAYENRQKAYRNPLNEDYDEAGNDYEEEVLEMVKADFECGTTSNDMQQLVRLFRENGDFPGQEGNAAAFYMECLNLGPAGFYNEYSDRLFDWDPDFVAEYGDKDWDSMSDEEAFEESYRRYNKRNMKEDSLAGYEIGPNGKGGINAKRSIEKDRSHVTHNKMSNMTKEMDTEPLKSSTEIATIKAIVKILDDKGVLNKVAKKADGQPDIKSMPDGSARIFYDGNRSGSPDLTISAKEIDKYC